LEQAALKGGGDGFGAVCDIEFHEDCLDVELGSVF
jgi:hypothetical protein